MKSTKIFLFIVIMIYPIFQLLKYLKKRSKIQLEVNEKNELPSAGVIIPYRLETNPQLTKNFHIKEFKCNDGTEVPLNLYGNVQELANRLQIIRDHFNSPLIIQSAYRTESHNNKVGGAKRSQHLLASAADFKIKGYTPEQVQQGIKHLISTNQLSEGGLGMYKTFTHYDTRNYKSRWYG